MTKENTGSSENQDVKPRSEDTAAANEAGIYHEKDGSLCPGRPIKAQTLSGIQGSAPQTVEAAPNQPKDNEPVQDSPIDTLPGKRGTVSLQGQRRIMGEGAEAPVASDSNEKIGAEVPETPPQKGTAPLSPETKMELNRIIALPVEQRQEAMFKFRQSQRDVLGNPTQEDKFLQLDTEILRDGKGIKIVDENGTVYQIDYE